MCGGEEADIERARPLFEIMGEKIVVCGEAGQGQAVKVISQAITAVNCATLAQGLLLARQAGVDVDALLTTMDGGSSDSTMRALKGKPMLDHDFTPLFKLAHMLKDVQLCLAEARTAGGSVSHLPDWPPNSTGRAWGAVSASRISRPSWKWSRASLVRVCKSWRVGAHAGKTVTVAKTPQFAAKFCDSRACA